MLVLILERVKPSLRGELTRWLLQPKAGVFVGRVSALVREKLWEKVCEDCSGGACLMIWRTNTAQGFDMKIWGDPQRWPTDWEGLTLVTRPKKDSSQKGTGTLL